MLIISLLKVANFQVVLVTDGIQSFSIFTYRCGGLTYQGATAAIGFSFNDTFFANHPLSRQSNVNSIACVNSPNPSNVVYNIASIGGLLPVN